ncbi:hypothetical protein Goari_018242, partial [Gossypium aridum]|nr:hypothetical protein [Gossypium aridum]
QQQKHQSPPAPNTRSKESSQSSSGSSSSSSSSSPDNSTKSSPSPPRPSPGTSQSQSSANSTSSSPQISSSAPANGSSTTSSSTSSPKALGPTTLSTSKSPSSNSSDGSSPSGGSNNSKQNNVSGHDKTLNYEGVIAATVVGVLVVVFIILFFYLRGRKKNRKSAYANYNRPPPTNFLVTSDAQVGHSPQHDTFHYNSQLHGQESSMVNSPQKEQNYHGPDSGIMAGSKTYFTYEELMEMTNGFARQNIIGEGGFGCVFKGWMADGRVVAVKQLKAGSGQGEREFRAEVEIISRVHHRHLVSLVGYSMAENQRLLIYEFVPNNTLEHHLHAKELSLLEWDKRVKIALGAAKGLAYLHEDYFGLARLNDTSQTHVSTRVMGTFGYLAPEYASSGKLTDRSDVYSFGVVLLELITGRKPIDSTQPLGDESLVEWARPLLIQALESGDFGELIDPRLKKHYVKSEMVRMVEAAAACVRHSSSKRPRMALVVRALDFEGDPDLSNGVKYGDSIAYDSGKYSEEIAEFRRMGLSSTENSSEIDMYSSEYNSKEMERGQSDFWKSQNSSGDYTSGELRTKATKNEGRKCCQADRRCIATAVPSSR